MTSRLTQSEYKRLNSYALSPEAWNEICARFGSRCAACRQPKQLTVDHIVPKSKGGTNDASNFQPLCRSCNSRKMTRQLDFSDVDAVLPPIGTVTIRRKPTLAELREGMPKRRLLSRGYEILRARGGRHISVDKIIASTGLPRRAVRPFVSSKDNDVSKATVQTALCMATYLGVSLEELTFRIDEPQTGITKA